MVGLYSHPSCITYWAHCRREKENALFKSSEVTDDIMLITSDVEMNDDNGRKVRAEMVEVRMPVFEVALKAGSC
jgi:hypothetical protein